MLAMVLRLLVAALATGTHFVQVVQAISVSIPLQAPASAATLDSALVSFSIEQDRWTDWAGTTTPNTFFLNALDNLARRTGQPPWLRIGADSEDHTDFNPSVQFSEEIFPAASAVTPYPEASNVTVGEGYYKLARQLPRGTRVIWGVNFGTDNLTAAFLEAHAIKSAFASSEVKDAGVSLEFVEIGNEPDLYGNNGHRQASTWTVGEYVTEWTSFAVNVSVAAGITSGAGPKFFGCAFGGTSHSASSFSPQGAFANGLLDSPQGKLITTISQHLYSGSGTSGNSIQSLMLKSAIRGNLSSLSTDIAAVHSQGLDYVLGETNSYYGHGAPGVSNAAGAALWILDYALFATQLGIKRAHFHEGVGYKYNLIQPTTLTRSITDGTTLATPLSPHVQPAYYGALVAAEVVGLSGAAKAIELDIDDAFLAGYAVYEGRTLRRVVLINSEAYLSTDTGARSAKNVTLAFSGSGQAPARMSVKRLAIGHADDTSGLTWAGQSFETADALPSGALQAQTADVGAGVSIQDTEAVLLSFN